MSIKIYTVALSWLLAALASPLRAAEPPIEIPRIDFTAEMALPSFPIGSAIDIHLDSKQIEEAGGASHLHARIIRGSKLDLKTRVHYLTRDGCLFFRTAVYSLAMSARGIQVMIADRGPSLTLDIGWLSHEADTVGQDQGFVLVLEKKGRFEESLKIRPQDVDRYFDAGLEFVVKANRRLRPDEERDLIRRGKKSLEATTVAAVLPGGCRIFSKISIDSRAFLHPEPCPAQVLAAAVGWVQEPPSDALRQMALAHSPSP